MPGGDGGEVFAGLEGLVGGWVGDGNVVWCGAVDYGGGFLERVLFVQRWRSLRRCKGLFVKGGTCDGRCLRHLLLK